MNSVLWFTAGFVAFPFCRYGISKGWQVLKELAYFVKDKISAFIKKLTSNAK